MDFWNLFRKIFGEPTEIDSIGALIAEAMAKSTHVLSEYPSEVVKYVRIAFNDVRRAIDKLETIQSWREEKNQAIDVLKDVLKDLKIMSKRTDIPELVERKAADIKKKLEEALELVYKAAEK